MGSVSQVLSIGYNQLSSSLQGGPPATSTQHFTTLRDYQHARKVFIPNNSGFAPKTKSWFHIFFELDQVAINSVNKSLQLPVEDNRIMWKPEYLNILGILVKNVKLPSFDFEVKENNQYNRKSMTTSSIRYEPIQVIFWDDMMDVIRGFWYAYYQYLTQDSRYVNWSEHQGQGIKVPNQLKPTDKNFSSIYSSSDNWGSHYGLDTVDASNFLNRTNPFFRAIRIYQFNRGKANGPTAFTEYVLVNPIITNFAHDNLDFSANELFMTNQMTVKYETVLYNSGFLSNNEIASWDAVTQTFFDTTPSPLTGFKQEQNTQFNGVVSQGVELGTQAIQLGMNTGQASIGTFLTSAVGTSQALNLALQASSANPLLMQVPSVIDGYGTGGTPPSILQNVVGSAVGTLSTQAGLVGMIARGL